MSRIVTADPLPTPAANGKACEANGKPAEHDAAKSADPQPTNGQSRVERAEELADRIAVGVAVVTSSVGRNVVRLAAHLREAVSDIWAEAQSIRRGEGKG